MKMPIYNSQNNDSDSLEMNLTPLIDVLFILLIFFLVSVVINQKDNLNVDVTENKESENKESKTVVLHLKADGTLSDINHQPVKDVKLFLKDRTVSKKNPLIIRPDDNVSAQLLISVLEKCQAAGAENVSLAKEGKN